MRLWAKIENEKGSAFFLAAATVDRIKGNRLPIRQLRVGATCYVDHLNTPRLVADDQQRTVWRWDQQEPFGVNVPDENPSGLGAFEFPLRFPGQYADKETNLSYNYSRDYDPGIGRYPQSDPIGLSGGINTYLYAFGSPLSSVDPYGEVGLAGVAAIGGLVVGTLIYINTPRPIPGKPKEDSSGFDIPGQPSIGPLPRPDPIEARRSDEERATDVPSWSRYYLRKPNERCDDYAKRILEEHYGCDDPRAKERGPGSEYSKIKKHCERR